MKLHKMPAFFRSSLLPVGMFLAPSACANADLIVNNPAPPIIERVTINPIVLSNDDGTNTAEFMGTAAQEVLIKDLIDEIWGQAGIDIFWQPVETWNNSFVNIGNSDPRPTSDLNSSVVQAGNAMLLDPDSNVLNMFFVQVAAGFEATFQFGNGSDATDNFANGLAFVGGNGISQHVGDNLPGFANGRDSVASVIAHEIGHNLGLEHLSEAENLMQPGGSANQGARINTLQIGTAINSSFSVPIAIPEPGMVIVFMASALPLAIRRRRSVC